MLENLINQLYPGSALVRAIMLAHASAISHRACAQIIV